MQCPVCIDEMLRISERQGIEIDYCPRCRGVWLDRGELDKIIERANDVPPPRHADNYDYMDDVRKRKNDDRYGHRSPIGHHTHRSDHRDTRYDRRYDDRDYRRKKSKSKKAKDFLEEIFDIFD
jgi:Zn-finger nucleic acid-binding protein